MNNNWEKLGFLDGISPDKQEYILSVLDYTARLQHIDDIGQEYHALSEVDIIFIPIIFRIAREVYINENDINNIFSDIRDNYNLNLTELKSRHNYIDLDYEVMYAVKYTENKINEYKNNLNENKD